MRPDEGEPPGTSAETISAVLVDSRSLFTDANLVRLRYRFSSRWELETQSGTATGGDLFYTIQFR